jgi:predicted PhzF superfamily epimerase YddE/YHI9
MREIRYELCDVFTDRPLAGNALAVFTDADGMDGATMQALARETHLSESSFVLSPAAADATAAIRIFTPTMELPFAGHPTLGTAFVLAAREGRAWKCRVFAPGEGIAEDPATGAAAGPLAVHLARHGRIAFGDEIVIEQGVEIGRPSTLHACASSRPPAK